MDFPYYHRSNVSRLEAYRSEIVAMRASNWPFHKIAEWLSENHQMKVSKEAIRQFCKVRSIGRHENRTATPKTRTEATSQKQASKKFDYDDSKPISTKRKL
jgi:IS30 family transposase